MERDGKGKLNSREEKRRHIHLQFLSAGEGNSLKLGTGQTKAIKLAVSFLTSRSAVRIASRRDTPCRRSHEFRADRIADGLAQDLIDLGFGRGIERPANHFVDGL
jgi:hypothetical protein